METGIAVAVLQAVAMNEAAIRRQLHCLAMDALELRAAKLYFHSRRLLLLHGEAFERQSIEALRAGWAAKLHVVLVSAERVVVLRQQNMITTRGKFFARWLWVAKVVRRRQSDDCDEIRAM